MNNVINGVQDDVCQLPQDNVCEYITSHCNNNIFKIAKFYYCSPDDCALSQKYVLIPLLALLLIFLFISIGIITSNHLSPILQYICKFCHIDEKLAGLTLLSFGNGSTDLFSTYQAMSQHSTSLAIGELVGSSLFLVSFVIGCMGIFKPFKVNHSDFITDLVFFTCLISISFYFIQDGLIKIWECVMMCLLYIAYLSYLIYVNYYKQQAISASDALVEPVNSIQAVQIDVSKPIVIVDSISSITLNSTGLSQEYLVKLHSFLNQIYDRPSHPANLRQDFLDFNNRESENQLLLGDTDWQFTDYTHLNGSRSADNIISYASPSSLSVNKSSPTTSLRVLDTIFSDFHGSFKIQQKSEIPSFIFEILKSPINLVLKITIPIIPVEPSKIQFLQLESPELLKDKLKEIEEMHNNYKAEVSYKLKMFNFSQVLLIPFICNNILQLSWTVCTVVSVSLFLVNLCLSRFLNTNSHFFFIAILLFMVILNYITLITSLIISILKNCGLILHIHESLLGLTVLSLGNSVGDLISNVTLSRLGLHITGLNACFGAPLLYVLLGIGINGLVIMVRTGQSEIDFNITSNLKISCFGLFCILAFYWYIIPKNDWVVGTKIGLIAVGWWWIINIIDIMVEI